MKNGGFLQVMLPEAVAIVVAPTDPTRQVLPAHN